MLTVKELKSNVWELTLTGVVSKNDIETMERALTPVLTGDQAFGLIVRAEGWKDMAADAMAADARFEIRMLAHWSKIAKMAVVTDLQALAAVLKWFGPILPMIDMRAFGSSDVAAAEAFVSDLPTEAKPAEGCGVNVLSDGTDGLIAYEIDGRITSVDVDTVMAPMEAHMKEGEKVDLLVRFKNWGGFDPALLTDGALMGRKMAAITHLRRYAVVGAPGWMKALVGGASALMPFQMKLFDLAEEDAAWTWVRAA
jgi:hypothetical protein